MRKEMSKQEAKQSQYRYILSAALKRSKRDHLIWNNRDVESLTICTFAYQGLNITGVIIEYSPKDKKILNVNFSCVGDNGKEYTRYINF